LIDSQVPVLRLRTPSEILAEPITWAIDQIVPSGMVTILSGKDKMGKTLLAWEMAAAVSRGKAFLGQFQTTKADVVVLALDDPAVVTRDRLEQLDLVGE
jgi:RecA-family ATPase